MADIAILVAEEYERRVKAGGANPLDMGTLVSSMARSLKSKIGNGGGSDNYSYSYYTNVVAKYCVSDPKTEVALAASHGFFSA